MLCSAIPIRATSRSAKFSSIRLALLQVLGVDTTTWPPRQADEEDGLMAGIEPRAIGEDVPIG